MSIQTPIEFTQLIHRDGERLFVTSLEISNRFGKQHKDILRAIENLECSQEFNRRNFAPITYNDARNRPQPMYHLTRDGFVFLVMGFSGQQAAVWKERYIEAFNWMHEQLNAPQPQPQIKPTIITRLQAELLKSRPRLQDVYKLSQVGYGRRKIARMLHVNESTIRSDVSLLNDCGFPLHNTCQQLSLI